MTDSAGAAFLAAAEDGEVAHVGLEAVPLVEGGDQGTDRVRADLGDPAAVAADQVHVVGVGGQVVRGRAVPEVGVRDHADLLEQLERAVNGRDVDAARGLLDLSADLLRGRVTEPRHRLQDELALRGHPVATGTQLLVPAVHGQARRRYSMTWCLRRGPVHGHIVVRPCTGPRLRIPPDAVIVGTAKYSCLSGDRGANVRGTRERRWSESMHDQRTREVA